MPTQVAPTPRPLLALDEPLAALKECMAVIAGGMEGQARDWALIHAQEAIEKAMGT